MADASGNVTTGATPVTNPLPKDPLVGQTTGKEESLANWAGPYVTQMLGQAQALSQTPYQTYGGPLTAGTSPLQQQYFGGLGSIGFPSQLGKSFTTPGVAQQYMNPYMSAVQQQLQRQADTQRTMLGPQNVQGAFGSRSGLANQQINAELMRQQQQAQAQAYNQAQQQFNTEQQQAAGLAGMMGQAGAQQRAIQQEGITADLNEFLQQRDYPMKMLQFRQSMLQGLPISAVSQMYQQPSGLSSFLGNASGILGLLQQMGVIPKG